MDRLKKHCILSCIVIFFVCIVARIIEYFFIRTDETFLSENFIHKVFGIIVLIMILRLCQQKWKDIGFSVDGIISEIGKGLLLGCGCFVIAYGIECFILCSMNKNVSLSFYVSGFSLSGSMEQRTGILFILLCIIFNLINVWMEEGVFRGLFTKILEDGSYIRSIIFIAFLFGIWHWVMPLRDFMEGKFSLTNLLVMGIGYIILAGIMSVKWSLLYKMSGSLWMGLGDHLFNNVIVTNLVHIISNNEADNMQIARILIGQLLSFCLVMIWYRKIRIL